MLDLATTSLPGPGNIATQTLDNGLRVLVRENHNSPSLVLAGYLPGGAVLETPEQAGLSAFTASLLLRGTATRSFEQINEAVESAGASLSIYSGRHTVGFEGKALAEDFSLLLDVLADALQRPVFPAEHVERVRGQRLTALQERDHDTQAVASMLFHQLAYPAGHPYSRPLDGFRATIGELTRAHLVEFYQRSYGPAGGVLVVVGDVPSNDVLAQVEAALGGWRAQPALASRFPEVARPTGIVRQEQVLAGKTQVDIVLGAPALRRNDPDYYAARLADTVLGRFGMMGRLGENVREQLGLAYYAYSALEASREPGAWTVVAGVDPVNVERCLAAVTHEIARLGAELVSEEELNDCKAFLVGSLPLRLETNGGVAQTILDMVWYDLGLDYLQRYGDLINSLRAEQVRSATARYLRPDAYALAIAGAASEGSAQES